MNFVVFSAALWDWNDGVQPGPQVSRELARLGHRVLFIQPRPLQIAPPGPPLQIMSLRELGLAENRIDRAWHGLDVGPLETVAANLLTALRTMAQPDTLSVAIWFTPFGPFAQLLPVLRAHSFRPVYYPQDDFEDLVRLGSLYHNLQAEAYLAREAELVVAVSAHLAEKMHRWNQVCVIPNGINLNEFVTEAYTPAAEQPAQLLRGERTLGFWGWLGNSMVDAELLAYIARSRSTWGINLLGGCETQLDHPNIREQLQHFPNIRFLGEVPHARLKDYGRWFDVCLIPAPDNDFSRGRDPLKVYEYLALHKPVVSTHMPQLAGMPYVHNASTPAEFLREIELTCLTPVDAARVDEFLAQQTWKTRAERFLDVLSQTLGDRPSGSAVATVEASPALPAPNFTQESVGVKVYVTELETDLESTRRWAKELEELVRIKDRELAQIKAFPPIYLALAIRARLRRFLSRAKLRQRVP